MTRSGACSLAGQHSSATSPVPTAEASSTTITSQGMPGCTCCAARCDKVAGSSAAESWQQTTTLTPGLVARKSSPVSGERAVNHCTAAELRRPLSSGSPIQFAPLRIVQQCAYCACHQVDVLRVELHTCIAEHFRHRRLIACDDAASGTHRFEHRQAESFVQGWEDEKRTSAKQERQLVRFHKSSFDD